jgi:hypothetical protein
MSRISAGLTSPNEAESCADRFAPAYNSHALVAPTSLPSASQRSAHPCSVPIRAPTRIESRSGWRLSGRVLLELPVLVQRTERHREQADPRWGARIQTHAGDAHRLAGASADHWIGLHCYQDGDDLPPRARGDSQVELHV